MNGCLPPSEIPGLTADQARIFGDLAEEIIYADFRARYTFSPLDLYVDDRNPATYVYFLQSRNPHLLVSSQQMIEIWGTLGMKRPDLLIHAPLEKAFYEIKPASVAGYEAGVVKVGYLSATYLAMRVPYRPGLNYSGTRILVAYFGVALRAYLRADLRGPGLILYELCVETTGVLALATLAALLRYIVKQFNEQQGGERFRPVDLGPAFARDGQLAALAAAMGLVMVVARRIPWSFFWKAVVRRFAVRGAAAATLTVADGPLPIGDLLAFGLTIWTVVDIIRLSDELWQEAGRIQEGA